MANTQPLTTAEILGQYKLHAITEEHGKVGKVYKHPAGHVLQIKTDGYGTKYTWHNKTDASGHMSYDGGAILSRIVEFHSKA